MVHNTIVIGLGSAGCTAASTLAQAGKRVLALEAQGRIGGRVHTVPVKDGVVELGAEWIHGTYPSRVFEAAVKNRVPIMNQVLNFQLFKSDGSEGDWKLLSDLMRYAFAVADDPPPVPEPLGQYISRRLIEYIKTEHPSVSNDNNFIESFLFFMDLLMDNIDAANSWNDVSTASKYEPLEGHQHGSWHTNGYLTFFDILLDTYKNGPGFPNLEIQLNKEVSRISWPQEPAQDVVVTCADGSVYRARNVIVTVSLGVLKERHQKLFQPNLPPEKVNIINNISIGVMDKIVLIFDEVWWPPGVTFFGFLWDTETRLQVHHDDEWVTRIFAASRPLGSANAVTLWTSGDAAKVAETLPEDVVKAKVMGLLRRFMRKDKAIPEPTAILRSSWHSNPFTRGSYTYDNLLTPQHPTARVDLGRPLVDSAGEPRVLFAGEATNPKHFSTVHGAAETGYREAARLLALHSKI